MNATSIKQDETVLAFLKRMQAEQILQTRHAAAPRLAVMEDLGDTGDLVPWVANTALFVRASSLSYKHPPPRQIVAPHCGPVGPFFTRSKRSQRNEPAGVSLSMLLVWNLANGQTWCYWDRTGPQPKQAQPTTPSKLCTCPPTGMLLASS